MAGPNTRPRGILCLSITGQPARAYYIDLNPEDLEPLRAMMPFVTEVNMLYPLAPDLAKIIRPGFADTDFAQMLKPSQPTIIKPS